MGLFFAKRLIAIVMLLWPLTAAAQMSVPVYGNWCGPDYPASPGLAGPPVDALDAACMRHDYCTAARGRFDCGCDLAMMNELRFTRWATPAIQANARGIYDAIAIIPCTDPLGTAQKQSLFVEDALSDILNGNAAPVNIIDRWRRLFLQNRWQ